MKGVNVSQYRAKELGKDFSVFLDPETGFWVETEGLEAERFRYHVYLTGDIEEVIPASATPFTTG